MCIAPRSRYIRLFAQFKLIFYSLKLLTKNFSFHSKRKISFVKRKSRFLVIRPGPRHMRIHINSTRHRKLLRITLSPRPKPITMRLPRHRRSFEHTRNFVAARWRLKFYSVTKSYEVYLLKICHPCLSWELVALGRICRWRCSALGCSRSRVVGGSVRPWRSWSWPLMVKC